MNPETFARAVLMETPGPDPRRTGVATKELRELAQEFLRVRADSRFLMQHILEHGYEQTDQEHIPNHHCDFVYQPDMGACTFHEDWFSASERNGYMDDWGNDAIASQEKA